MLNPVTAPDNEPEGLAVTQNDECIEEEGPTVREDATEALRLYEGEADGVADKQSRKAPIP